MDNLDFLYANMDDFGRLIEHALRRRAFLELQLLEIQQQEPIHNWNINDENHMQFHLNPPPPAERPADTLQRLSNDAQNVHTEPVNAQTSTNMKILLDTPVPPDQNTLTEIKQAIMGKRQKPFKYIEDMETWYTVRSSVDPTYKQLLDGLWARIKRSPHTKELVKRLREEIRESDGKCTQGHFSRLCNVMVGFDDDMQPILSQGELIQNKIALIAAKEVSVEEKVMEALHFFKEIGLPPAEQKPWIDAL